MATKPNDAGPEIHDWEYELEREKVAIERKKLELEFRKLKIEKRKSDLTIASIAIPLFVVMITVIVSSFNESTRAKAEFKMKSAELIMAHQDPYEMKGRAKILRDIFPEYLSQSFADSFNEQQYRVDIFPEREELIRLLADHKDQQAEIIRMWQAAYQNDTWVQKLQPSSSPKK